MQFAQICDQVETDAATNGALDVSALTGVWINSNPDTNGIARMLTTEAGGKLYLQVYAVGSDGLIDWGATGVALFTSSPSSRTVAGFTCIYDFGFAETRLQAMIMKGLIVLAQFHRFKDESKRADFFVREYFAMTHERY